MSRAENALYRILQDGEYVEHYRNIHAARRDADRFAIEGGDNIEVVDSFGNVVYTGNADNATR